MLNLQQTATEESKLIRDRFPFEPERVISVYRYEFFMYYLYVFLGGGWKS
jgi:hypothetical protein